MRSPSSNRALLVGLIILVPYALYSMGPLVWLLLSSLKSRAELFSMPPSLVFEPNFDGYAAVFGFGEAEGTAAAQGVFAALANSVVISVSGTLLAVLLGTLGGYAASRFDFRGKGDFMFFILSTRMVPPIAVLVSFHMMFAELGLTDTHIGLILITTFINVGLATWIMKGFFDGVPREVEQVALINGYTRLYAFRRLVLPMVKGGIAATAGFCFIFSWNEFVFSSVLSTTTAQTLPVKISAAIDATGIAWQQICAAGVVLIVPVVIFFWLIRHYLLMGMTFGVLGRRN